MPSAAAITKLWSIPSGHTPSSNPQRVRMKQASHTSPFIFQALLKNTFRSERIATIKRTKTWVMRERLKQFRPLLRKLTGLGVYFNGHGFAMTRRRQMATQRQAFEIEKLIKRRVAERDSWPGPPQPSAMQIFKMAWDNLSKFVNPDIPSKEELDREFPVQKLDWDRLKQFPRSANDMQVTWLGHASLLVQMGGMNILTDPVFSERLLPVSFAGPVRFRMPPCTLEELTGNLSVDCVVISHNHYDHLEYQTMRHLAKAFPDLHFVVPLGVRLWFLRFIFPGIGGRHTVHELDWHEKATISERFNVTAVPMKHWSNRVGDKDKSLWCGYVLQSSAATSTERVANVKFLFAGDTAWFDGLGKIGQRYGPFDLGAIPIGGYEPNDFMKVHHLNPEEAVKMKTVVQANTAIPIHWGTFPLSLEPVFEPRDKLLRLMGDDKSFQPWLIGQTKRFPNSQHLEAKQ